MARPSPLDIYALLDKSNCGDCGLSTCMAFGTDLLERKVTLEDCTHLMKDPKQAKNLAKLREITTPPQRPLILRTSPILSIFKSVKYLEIASKSGSSSEISIKISKALNDLDEIADDVNLQPYTRTQIWNVVSILEKINK